jgi:two-component system LytT family response regulator
MIRIGIVDDEQHARDTMREMLSRINIPKVIVLEAGSVASAVESLKTNTIDLLFLDIHLQDGTGFDVLEQLTDVQFDVVFVTAYDKYALEAFKFAAINYILKPVMLTDIKESLVRAMKRSEERYESHQFDIVPNNMEASDYRNKKILIPQKNESIVVKISEILRLESDGNYTWFILTDSTRYLVTRTMKEFEELLCNNGFCRIHQSFIINMDFVKKYIKGDGGDVVMTDGKTLPIARNRKDAFLRLLSS